MSEERPFEELEEMLAGSKLRLHFILENGKPVCMDHDILRFAEWFGSNPADRIVEQTHVGPIKVSTVFLALNHAIFSDPPVLWETMLFIERDVERPKRDASLREWGIEDPSFFTDMEFYDECYRYTTLAEAKKGHWDVVGRLRDELDMKDEVPNETP